MKHIPLFRALFCLRDCWAKEETRSPSSVNSLEEWLMVFFLFNDDWLWRELTYHASFTWRIYIFNPPRKYYDINFYEIIIWLNGIRQSLTKINISSFAHPRFYISGFYATGLNGSNQSTYIKGSTVPENIRCESREIRVQEGLAQLGATRVQKNENYLSAEQCRLTVSTARPNDDPHYSLTAGMRSVHTRLAIHVAFCTGQALREPRRCLKFRWSYRNICAKLTLVGNNHYEICGSSHHIFIVFCDVLIDMLRFVAIKRRQCYFQKR